MASVAPSDGAGPARKPGSSGFTWNEVRERVQHSDGSVRTSPPTALIREAAGASAASPPRQPRIHNVGAPLSFFSKATSSTAGPSGPSRGGSSRGCSSSKSSRSASADPHGRDGDISCGPGPGSRCSSGGGWDTSTNSSEHSRPRTPPDAAPSPSGPNGLLMPDPIRTNLALPPTLFAEAEEQVPEGKGDSALADFGRAEGAGVDDVLHMRPGGLLKWDPYGRDPPRRREPPAKDHSQEWSADSLVDHFRGVVLQIEHNMQNHGVPTAEKLDAFVSSLHRNTQRHLKRAPKDRRNVLKVLLSRRNLMSQDNRRSTTPEELRTTLNSLIEDLLREFPRSDAAGTGPG